MLIRLIDDYYNPQFHFCEPEGGAVKQPEGLGSILFGDRIFNSDYDVRLLYANAPSPMTLSFSGSHDAIQWDM